MKFPFAKFCFLVLFVLSFANCLGAIADKGGHLRNASLLPNATILRSSNYTKLGSVEVETSQFFLWGMFPVTNPLNPEYALSQAIQARPGTQSIINAEIWHETHYYFPIGTVSVMKIKGEAITWSNPKALEKLNAEQSANPDSKDKDESAKETETQKDNESSKETESKNTKTETKDKESPSKSP